MLRREGTDTSLGGGPQTVEQPQVTVTKFMMLQGNYGKEAQLLPKPPEGKAEADSDDPDGDAPSKNCDQQTLSKRNARFMTKHALKVMVSGPASGNGLFSAQDIPACKELPVKGPWFDSTEEVNNFLASLHAETAASYSKRVVRVDLAPEADGPPAASQGQEQQKSRSLYKVITNPIGFVNHFTGLSTQPNCKLVWKEGVPLGEHCLILKSTKPIKTGREWLLNYGPHHQCGERVARKRPGAGGAGGKGKRHQGDDGVASPVPVNNA